MKQAENSDDKNLLLPMSGQTRFAVLQLSLESCLGGTSQLLLGGNSNHHSGFKMEGALRALIFSVFCLFLATHLDSLRDWLAKCGPQTAASASHTPDLGPQQPGGGAQPRALT